MNNSNYENEIDLFFTFYEIRIMISTNGMNISKSKCLFTFEPAAGYFLVWKNKFEIRLLFIGAERREVAESI